ncbi:GNAT family N-acetyltransferase [Streptoalloteichus hindustanus]|uniref:Lysine N-acyltransferase MbtK n=1 Tax=Streptoalloteichus hindustanus TaxID=2017 RepID=A0A1M5HCW3_STRHI|nr:GNAT family N-acetyltransferase [Streptoalloteichus hindustanus]SHG13829.1 Protein N-acetyltransferase, RimJ/RimL family [Streptoalloteichus hindustanus]
MSTVDSRPAGGEADPAPPGPPLPRLAPPWSARAARPEGGDLELVHRWMLAPHVAAFWQQAWPLPRWAAELAGQLAGVHSLPCLVSLDDDPVAYLEVYRVAMDQLAGRYPHRPHDLGVHVAVGELGRTGRGLGRALLREVAQGLLAADPACARVVAEPDVGNGPSIRAFLAAGFVAVGEVRLPDKTAVLLVYPRTEEDLPR